jgi:predicted CXXCH cytochrome family protein
LEAAVSYTGKRVMFLLLLVVGWGRPLVAAEHPVPLPKDVQDKNCLECHDDKSKGKAVHSAMQMGCSTCHNVKSDGTTTTVELVAPKNELCFTCHEKSKEEVLHQPYEQGRCTVCHSPHSSDFPKQTRAAGNALCLGCHAERNVAGDKVALFAAQEIPAAEFAAIPKILPNEQAQIGHPFASHPVSGMADPTNPAQKISCLSCHDQHASSQEHLIRTAKDAKTGKDADICNSCHQAYEAQQRAANLKKYGAAEQQNQKDFEDKQRRQGQEQPQTPRKGTEKQ